MRKWKADWHWSCVQLPESIANSVVANLSISLYVVVFLHYELRIRLTLNIFLWKANQRMQNACSAVPLLWCDIYVWYHYHIHFWLTIPNFLVKIIAVIQGDFGPRGDLYIMRVIGFWKKGSITGQIVFYSTKRSWFFS